MDHRPSAPPCLALLALASASVLLVTGCTSPAGSTGPSATAAEASPPPSSSSSRRQEDLVVCSDLGNAEHVSVDLSAALPFEGGPYTVVVSSPELGASANGHFASDDQLRPGGWFAADVSAEPVTVRVSVTDGSGREVYRASTLATPRPYQPNGPDCDRDNVAVQLQGTPDGRLVDLPAGHPLATDARGRWSQAISTGCGVVDLQNEAVRSANPVWWVRVGGPLVGPDGGAPTGWNSPFQRGWVSVRGGRLTFEDERGHTEVFERAPGTYSPPGCPTTPAG